MAPLVTLEGLDGSGKTTLLDGLRIALDGSDATETAVDPDVATVARDHSLDSDREVVFTREPTDSWYGEAVYRSLGTDDADPLAELFLYTADHAAHLSRLIRPALARDALVVSDRYSDSRYAYQGASLARSDLDLSVPHDHETAAVAREAPPATEDSFPTGDDPVAYVRAIHAPFTRPPDLTLYLDLDPTTAAERAAAENKFERAEFLADVRANYERLAAAAPERIVRIDATQPPAAVLETALTAIERRL